MIDDGISLVEEVPGDLVGIEEGVQQIGVLHVLFAHLLY